MIKIILRTKFVNKSIYLLFIVFIRFETNKNKKWQKQKKFNINQSKERKREIQCF